MSPQSHSARLGVVLAVTLLVQGLLQAIFFPFSALGDGKPLLHIDSPYHAYQMELARQLCAEHQLQGWDPYFGAGQSAGVTGNASAKVQATLVCLDGKASSVWPVYKAVSFVLGWWAPACIVIACMLLGLGVRVAAFAALLGGLMWWTGGLRWYHTAGLVSYVGMAYLVIPFSVAAVGLAQRPTAARLLTLALAGTLGFWLHPLFPVAAVLLGAPLLLVRWRELQRPVRGLLGLTGVSLLMLALNAAWVIPTVTDKMGIGSGIAYQASVSVWLPLLELLGRANSAGGGTRLGLALVLGVVLLASLRSTPARRTLIGLTLGAVVLMAWACVGASVPAIASLQPNRFSALAWLVCTLPAAAGVDAALRSWQALAGWRRGVLGLALMSVTLVVAFMGREVYREFTVPAGSPHYGVPAPEVKGDGAVAVQLVRFLREHTDPHGRIFFETSLARVHDGAHIAGVLALRADREFIGGPYPGVDFASAWDDKAFGTRLEALSASALESRLDAYNVRWMLCHRDACRRAMLGLPGVRRVADIGPVTAFEREASPGWVVQGGATVVARCHNRLELEGVTGERLVLRYHWVPDLRSLEGGRVEPEPLVAGARPFVAVVNPPARLTLRRGDGDGLPCAQRQAPAL